MRKFCLKIVKYFLLKADFLSSQKLLTAIFFSVGISQVILASMVLAPISFVKIVYE